MGRVPWQRAAEVASAMCPRGTRRPPPPPHRADLPAHSLKVVDRLPPRSTRPSRCAFTRSTGERPAWSDVWSSAIWRSSPAMADTCCATDAPRRTCPRSWASCCTPRGSGDAFFGLRRARSRDARPRSRRCRRGSLHAEPRVAHSRERRAPIAVSQARQSPRRAQSDERMSASACTY